MLGVIVLWMGLGKILGRYEVSGQDAAVLANLGLIKPVTPATAPPPAAPTTPAATPPTGAPAKTGSLAPIIRLASQPAVKYTASDFQTPVKVRKLYTLTLALKAASEPGAKPDGSPKAPTWPKALADGDWPVHLAWTAAILETAGGVGLLLGLLTRLWAIGLAARMLAAMWLTQFGPAIQAGDAVLGFLPPHETFDTQAWRPFLLHFSLFMTALALVFLGPGRASVDHAIFAPTRTDDDDDVD
jgi:uncharacterized membrane protein YphA (DoxX/SURF4 family)